MDALVAIGIVLAVLGLLVIVGVILSARLTSRRRQQLFGSEDPVIPVNLASINDAVLVARVGGQIVFANELARKWFSVESEDPDLWLLAQRVEPGNAFLELFATEGQAAFSISGRKVEARSHRVAVGDTIQFIVVIRQEAPLPILDREGRGSPQALQVLSEVNREINASLMMEPTLAAIMDGTRRLVAYDAGQLCLWEPEREVLRPAVRRGPEDYVAATSNDDQVYRRDEGLPGWLARRRQPLRLAGTNADSGPLDRPRPRPTDPPYTSYLGMPLAVRNRFVGTIELYAQAAEAFDGADQAILALLGEQAAIAIENARQYSSQSERVEELSGLQKIAGAISDLQDPRQLFAQLGQRIADLMGTEMVGVLLYDRDQERLVAQRPLHGVVDALASRYTIPLKPGTPARGLWETVSYWYSNDVANDHLVEELGLQEVVEMAGVKATAMAVMTVGEERIGVLQVSNKVDGTPFGLEDIRLLQTYAGHAAIVVQSARLYGQEQTRVAELQGLQQIVQAMSSFTNVEELYSQLTQRIAELMQVDVCGILLYEPEEERLMARTPFYGIPDPIASRHSISVGKRGLAREVWREHPLFVSNNVFTDETIDLLGLRDVARDAGLQTIMLAPLSAGGRRFGLLQVSNKTDGADFDEDDRRLIAIFAGQAAALIENARLYQDTDETLRKRAAELRSVSRISRELNATLELERILEVIAVEAQRAEGTRWGNLTMFDWDRERSEIMTTMRFGAELGPEARILEKAAANTRDALVIEDFERVSRYPSPIEGARSALIVPIIFEGEAVGVIGLYSDRPRGLGSSATEFVQALSSQATIAVTNATRHAEQAERSEIIRRRADQMNRIFELGRAFRSDQSVEGNLESVAQAIAESAGFDMTIISVLDEDGQFLRHVARAGIPAAYFQDLATRQVRWEIVQHYLAEKYQRGGMYLVPSQDSRDLFEEMGLPRLPDDLPELPALLAIPDRWQAGDLMLVPLRSSSNEPLGLLVIDEPRDFRHPTRDVAELLEIFANQAAVVIENSRLYRSAEERAEELSKSLENLERSYEELDSLSQEMIRKDVELSQANDLLNQRAQRLLALHRIMESVDTTRAPDLVLNDIASSVVEEMDIDQCLIMLPEGDTIDSLKIVAARGRVPDRIDLHKIMTGDDPVTTVYRTREPVIYAPGGKRGTPAARLAESIGSHTFALLPMPINSRGGLMLVGSTRSTAGFGDDDRDMFTLLASQIVVEYENAQLYQTVQDEAALAASDRDRLQQLHLITTALQQTRSLQDRLAIIARGIRSVGWTKVIVALLDKNRELTSLSSAGYSEDEEARLRESLLPGSIWEHRFDDADFISMRLGASYYLAHNHPWVIENVPGASADDQDTRVSPGHWHPKDQLYLPMYAGADIIGVLNLRDPADSLQPTVASLRPIELFVQQASSALENTRLYQETLELQSYTEAVVQSIQQGIVVTGADGKIETINAFMRNQLGWDDSLIGQDLFLAQPMLREMGLDADFKSVLQAGQPVERTNLQVTIAGAAHTLTIYLYPRYDDQRSVTGVVLLTEDVTQRARLEADIAQRGRQLAALNEVSRAISSTLDVQTVINHALDGARQVIQYDHLELWVRSDDPARLKLVGARGGGDERTIGLTVDVVTVPQFAQIHRDNMPLLLDDRPPTDTTDGKRHLRSWLGVPMISGGVMSGIMVFEKTEAHAYAPADSQVAAAFANQVAVALTNARLFEEAADRAAELDSRSQRLQLLNRISSTLGTSLDQNSILQTTINELTTALAAPRGGVILFDYDEAVGTLALQAPSNPDGSVEALTISLDNNPAIDHLLKTKAPLAVKDVAREPLVKSMNEVLEGRGVRSALLIPVIIGNAMIGLMTIEDTGAAREWGPEQIELVQTITNQAAVSVQNAQLFQETVARQRDLSILFEAGRIAASSLDLDTVMRAAAEYFTRSLDVDGCRILLLDRSRDSLRTLVEHTRSGFKDIVPDSLFTPLRSYPASPRRIAEEGALLFLTGQADLAPVEARWLKERGATSLMILGLGVREDIIGTVEVWFSHKTHHFSQREIRLGRALASSVATAMENARLHDETESRLEELALINEISRALTQIISQEDLHQTLQAQLTKIVRTHSLTIALLDPVTHMVTFPLAIRNDLRLHIDSKEPGGDPYSYVIETQEPLLLSRDIPRRLKDLKLKHVEDGLKSFLAIPLDSGEVKGALSVEDYAAEDAFSEATLRVLSPIAAQVAVSIENARLYGELEQRLSETTTLQEVSRVVNSALDLQEIFERVVSELADAFNYPLIGLFTVESGELVMQAYHGYTAREAKRFKRISLEAGITGRAATTGQAQLVQDVSKDPDYLPVRKWVRSEIAVPFISDQEVLGILSVSTGIDKVLKENDLTLMRTFAGQVAAAMSNARLYQQMVQLSAELEQRVEERTRQLREERDRIDTLYRIAVELTASLDLDMVLNRALELVGQAVGADTGALFLIDPQSDLLIHRASMMYDEILPPGGRQIPLHRHEGLAGWVMDNQESIVIDNVQVDPRWANIPGTEKRRSLLGAPLVASGEVLGCIFFNSDTEAAFNQEHLRLVEAAAQQVANSINNAELYRLIRDQAERLGVMLRSQQTEAAKSQAILESVADGVMVSDQAGEIILFNAAAERTLSLRRDQVLGRPASDLAGLYGPGAERWSGKIQEWQKSPMLYEGEFLSEQIELDERVISVHVSPVLHGAEYLGLVSVFRDITREVIADRVKSEFVARVSHELRTPMTSIKGYADLLLLGAAGEITSDQRRFLDTIKSNADRLSLLVNDLLDISRIEQGQIELDVRPVDVGGLITDVVKAFEGRKSGEGRTIPIIAEFPDDLPRVEADSARIMQVLTNLVSNAYSYTADEGTVIIRARAEGDGVQVDIQDTGIGIPEEDQAHIFERFFRGESHPTVFKTAGTGLGLAIVQQIIDMHRGRVWFESEQNVGSTFSFWLPATFPYEAYTAD